MGTINLHIITIDYINIELMAHREYDEQLPNTGYLVIILSDIISSYKHSIVHTLLFNNIIIDIGPINTINRSGVIKYLNFCLYNTVAQIGLFYLYHSMTQSNLWRVKIY